MRISDWSSDLCSSDLCAGRSGRQAARSDRASVPVGLSATGDDVHASAGGDLAKYCVPSLRSCRVPHAVRCIEVPPRLLDTIADAIAWGERRARSEEHTSELQSLMRISYAVFCLKKKKTK